MKLFGGGKISKPVKITLAAVCALVLIFAAFTVYAYTYKNIFPGVSAAGISLSGMTTEEAMHALDDACPEKYNGKEIEVAIEDFETITVSADELMLSFASDTIAEKAYAVGHEGNFFERVFGVMKACIGAADVGVSVEADEEACAALSEKIAKYDINPVDAAYTIEDETLILHPRSDGKKVDSKEFFERLFNAFAEENYEKITVERVHAESVALDIDKVYSEVHAEVKDAYVEKTDTGSKIVPHVLGIDFDLETARAEYDKNPNGTIRIPLAVTQPKVYTKHLETNLFKYCLAEVETYFSPKKVARTANVRLAASLVNGTVLNPGEEFSYNKVVGKRTAERGFKEAAIFSQGEVVDGIGGGICQVSSTIYMAALRANMKITERKNHAFYVDYTPKGEDATVVYGSIDFRFVNTSEYPIKIVATSKNNYIRIQIMGTEPDEKVTVKLTKKTHSTTPYTTREKTVTSLAAGKKEVYQKGQEGLSMSVYRNVYDKNGKLIESYLENNSKYKPMPQIIHVGAGASAPAVNTTPEEEKPKEETPAQTPSEDKPAGENAQEQEATTPPADNTNEAPAEATPAPEQNTETPETPAENTNEETSTETPAE